MGTRVRLTSDTGENLLCLMGDAPPQLTGGVGGTEVITLPRQTGAVTWNGHPPYGMVLKLMFDGFDTNSSVEADLKTLYRMARADKGARRPPSIKLSGPVPRTDLSWLIEAIDEGTQVGADVIRRGSEEDDARLRQQVTLTLVWDNDPEVVVTTSASKARGKRHKTALVHKGDTLREIAKRYHVDYAALKRLNKVRDPNNPKPGTRLRLP